ncbi:TetR family transcriptional regulator [Mycobacterium kubicae]|uniref:TetR family transcriptional regulator n=1 Tax=Mycobacterium kubicae TaxID=120959 RepID=A0AAX1J3U6_9MYCO|nr:TetR family transcriptional regulator [Mycobacterium kubicae]QNI12632.1 TetR/AcrR family transcriptional regulator [Mycobacterium kubicae]QPI36153.1 TetR family transcriptional regulator [Mycobacterium kubicae]GFG67982.1 TetR family transcriptional regulator [Mycobacterium kubicae]
MKDVPVTRRRILDAAAAEFAQYGIAGARVDRISAKAQANKAQLYSYFGSKDGLFDQVFNELAATLMGTVPFNADDLPGYAARLYDTCLETPEIVRLATWARLERVQVGEFSEAMRGDTKRKVDQIAEAQRKGVVNPTFDPCDVLAMAMAMALAWSPASLFYTATSSDPDEDNARRRRALIDMVRNALTDSRHHADQ